jgi:hypothetical protein
MSATATFVNNFIAFWKDPSPERVSELLHPDIVLLEPLAAPMHGIAAAQDNFRKIFKWLPDLRAEVDRWRGADDVVFIEFRLKAHFGRKLIEWPTVDRFVLRGDKAVEGATYFDALPLLMMVSKRPSTWWGWLTSGAGRPWRTGLQPAVLPRQLRSASDAAGSPIAT